MQSTVEQIGASLDMYYDGFSLTKITQHLDDHYHDTVDRSTVYRWLIHFTTEAIKLLEPLHPKVSDVWIADETSLIFEDKTHWIWDVMCRETRFLLASYLSPNRGTREARILMEMASKRAEKAPAKIITDSLRAYIDGIELVFGSDTKHIQSSPFAGTDSTNRLERMQGTIKERTKVVRGYKSLPTARLIVDGFLINYNFFEVGCQK
jgi:transposase-like protein